MAYLHADEASTELRVYRGTDATGGALYRFGAPLISPQTLGTLVVWDGERVQGLDVGSNGQVLTADSTADYGVSWATPDAAPWEDGDVLPDTDATWDLGSDTYQWNHLYATGITITGTSTMRDILPETNNTYDLGSSSYRWAELHATTGEVYGTLDVGNPSASAGTIDVAGSASTAGIFVKTSTTTNERVLQCGSGTSYGWRLNIDESATGDMFFYALNGGAETKVLHLDRSTPRLGINTTPSVMFHVNGESRINDKLHVNFNEGSTGDFVASSDNVTYMLFVDASADGCAVGTSTATLGNFTVGAATYSKAGVYIDFAPNPGTQNIIMQSGSTSNYGWRWMQNETTTGDMWLEKIVSGSTTQVAYFKRSNSYVKIGTGTPSALLHVGGDTEIDGALDHDGSTLGVFNTAPTTKQTVSGSRSGNAALASLLTALAAYGLITDSSSA